MDRALCHAGSTPTPAQEGLADALPLAVNGADRGQWVPFAGTALGPFSAASLCALARLPETTPCPQARISFGRPQPLPATGDGEACGVLVEAGAARWWVGLDAEALDAMLSEAFGGTAPAGLPPATLLIALQLAAAGALDALEARLGCDIALRLAPQPPSTFALTVPLSGARGAGALTLRTDEEGLRFLCDAALPAPSLHRAAPRDLALPLVVEVGPVPLTLFDVRTLEAGDLVLLPRSGGGFAGRVRLGAPPSQRTAAAQWQQRAVRIATAFSDSAARNSVDHRTMTDAAGANAAPETGEDRAAQSLDDVSVELVFELARRSITVGELASVGAGHVFEVDATTEDGGARLLLRVSGTTVGRGTLVRCADTLGVRVDALFGDG